MLFQVVKTDLLQLARSWLCTVSGKHLTETNSVFENGNDFIFQSTLTQICRSRDCDRGTVFNMQIVCTFRKRLMHLQVKMDTNKE
jgi:hypothetical protein